MPELIEGKEARKEIALSYLNRANLWLQKKVPKEQWNDGIERSVKESRQVAKVCREYIDGKVPVANLKAAIKKWARKFRWGEA